MQNNIESQERYFDKSYWIGFLISSIVGCLIGGLIILIETSSLELSFKNDTLHILTDCFAISGLLLILFYFLVIVSNNGAFDAIVYSVKLFWTVTFHSNVRTTNLPKNYAEYRALKKAKKRKPLSFMGLAGLVFLVIGIIFFVIYLNNR